MIRRYFSSLTGRFALSAFLMHLFMAPLLFGLIFDLVETNYQNNFVNQVRNNALILALFSESINENDLLNQQRIIEDAIASGRLFSAQLVSVDNKVLQKWGGAQYLTKHEEDFFFGEHGDTVFNIIVPRFDAEGNLQSELFLSYNEQNVNAQIDQSYRYGIYLSIAYVSIAFVLTSLISGQVARPLIQLRRASFEISEGHYEKPLHVESGIYDIQQLSHTLENMRHELVKKTSEMEYHAMHDSLTGLPNRLLLRHRIDEILLTDIEKGQSTALLLIDLDHFKEINDTLGHATGDEVLKEAALRIKSSIRESDTPVRLGGDEFAVLLLDISNENALMVANKLARSICQSQTVDGHDLAVGASIGVALHPEHGDTFKDVLHCADIAMYDSKRRRDGIAILYNKKLEINI